MNPNPRSPTFDGLVPNQQLCPPHALPHQHGWIPPAHSARDDTHGPDRRVVTARLRAQRMRNTPTPRFPTSATSRCPTPRKTDPVATAPRPSIRRRTRRCGGRQRTPRWTCASPPTCRSPIHPQPRWTPFGAVPGIRTRPYAHLVLRGRRVRHFGPLVRSLWDPVVPRAQPLGGPVGRLLAAAVARECRRPVLNCLDLGQA